MVSIFPLWYTLLVVYPFFLHNEHPNQEPKPKGFNTLCNWLIDQCLRYIRFVNVWSIYLLVYPFFLHNEHLNQELNKAKGLNILLHTLISVYVCHMFSSSFKLYLQNGRDSLARLYRVDQKKRITFTNKQTLRIQKLLFCWTSKFVSNKYS